MLSNHIFSNMWTKNFTSSQITTCWISNRNPLLIYSSINYKLLLNRTHWNQCTTQSTSYHLANQFPPSFLSKVKQKLKLCNNSHAQMLKNALQADSDPGYAETPTSSGQPLSSGRQPQAGVPHSSSFPPGLYNYTKVLYKRGVRIPIPQSHLELTVWSELYDFQPKLTLLSTWISQSSPSDFKILWQTRGVISEIQNLTFPVYI